MQHKQARGGVRELGQESLNFPMLIKSVSIITELLKETGSVFPSITALSFAGDF